MKVLIVTYYWPPAGGSGVQRWLKFVKYLQVFGIEPTIYTVKNPNYIIEDSTLEIEVPENVKVIRQPIFEPNNILSSLKNKDKQSAGFLNPNPSFFGKILQYIRANYFIPDARKYWVKPSVKYLKKYLPSNKINIVITTGPPHSMHLIGLQLKKELDVKWISDFRDPWTEIDYFHQLPLSKNSKRKHFLLEKEVLEKSDSVLVIGKTMKEKYSSNSKNVHIITNGFDSDSNQEKNNLALDTKFTITHIGMMNADRNPKYLWEVLSDICKEDEEFKNNLEVKLIGKIAEEVKQDLNNLDIDVSIIDYLPHNEVKVYQQKAQLLLLSVNNVPSAKGIITGKIFEYLQAKRPILAIGPENGDLSEIINNTNAGVIVDFKNKERLKLEVLNFYAKYKNESLHVKSKNIDKYHRKNLTKELSEVIKNIAFKEDK